MAWILVNPPTKLENPQLGKDRSRLDRIRESMRLTIPKLNSLLKDVLGSHAPKDFSELNCGQIGHVIRYLKRHEARLLMERNK